MSLSVCIITLDEEDDLPRCLASVKDLATQIVVVDSLSTDGTRRIAADAGAEVIERAFQGHVRQKQFALEQARGDWVLCLDADEWLDEELRAAVARVVGGDAAAGASAAGGADAAAGDGAGASPPGRPASAGPVAYAVNRRTWYLGGWIEHGGWSPEWRLRLGRRGAVRWAGVDPHDRLEADGPTGRLGGRLNHRPYRDLGDHLEKLGRYTDVMAARRREAGERGSLVDLALRPPARFLRMYVLRAGFLDGWRGFVLASFGAFYVFLKYAKLLVATRGADAAPR